MNIALAVTWYPRGELPRFNQLQPVILQQYSSIVISYFHDNDNDTELESEVGKNSSNPHLKFYVNDDRRMGRYMALKEALELPADYIHYMDMDRLLRWVETRPLEWQRMVNQISKHDCIIFGRTATATQTHPHALITTEMLSNQVVSHFLNMDMDVSAGSKSFSRQAAQYLVDHGAANNSIGTDAEWPILLKQAGFRLEYIPVEGLDWETADHYQEWAANGQEQKQAAATYDYDPHHWQQRIEIAGQIIQTALEIAARKVTEEKLDQAPQQEFDFKAVFDVDDYLYFYSEALTDERTEKEVNGLVSLLALDEPRKILDLACGFGRHTNRLAAMGHSMTGIDLMPGFLDIARRDAIQRNVEVDYQLGDMRDLGFENEFDYVLLLFTALGYFSDEENLQVLVNARKALKPGGRLVFDVQNRDQVLNKMKPFYVIDKEGNMMIDRISFDSLNGKFYNRRVVYRDGVRKDKPYYVRVYNPNELKTLITQADLELEHIYGDWDGKELTADSYRLVVIARKPS
jgi:SAM-dependent methyltransferase